MAELGRDARGGQGGLGEDVSALGRAILETAPSRVREKLVYRAGMILCSFEANTVRGYVAFLVSSRYRDISQQYLQ